MKTQNLIKEKNTKSHFYNTLTGIYKWGNVSSTLVKIIFYSIFFKFAYVEIFDSQNFDILDIESNVNRYVNGIKILYENIHNLNFLDRNTILFFSTDILLVTYLSISIYMYYKSKVVQKLSNLGLENYVIKLTKKGYLLKLKDGEEMEYDFVKNGTKDDIKQVFKIDMNKSIKITRYAEKDILIEVLPQLEQYEIERLMLKRGLVYFGKSREDGNVYRSINNLSHFLIAGASGSGKSVLQNLIISSLIHNIYDIESLYLIDLKGGAVEFGRYRNHSNNIMIIEELWELLSITRELINIMKNRYDEMSKNGITFSDEKPIFVIIDEYASVETQSFELQKEEAKELKNNLKTLLQKSRAANIKIIVATQKATSDSIDTTLRENIQSRILMKTKSRDAQKAVVNDLEIMEELDINPARFNKGQYLFIDDHTCCYFVMQCPFVSDNFNLDLKYCSNLYEAYN